jgi:hypothetical protein
MNVVLHKLEDALKELWGLEYYYYRNSLPL